MARTASIPETPDPGRLAQPELPGRPCSVARALDVIGEKWALLAIREISFGNRRFNEIARNTGAPRDRLAARLHSLVEAGILERREYQASPPRAEYGLTAAGQDLTPVLRALLAWGDRWVSDEPPATLMHGDHALDPVQVCRHCGAEAPTTAVSLRVNSRGWDVRGPAPAGELAAAIRTASAFPASPCRDRLNGGGPVTAREAAVWDAEYADGRYAGDPPVEFVRDIVAAAREHGLRHGLYVGCGNGRNLLPLLDAGLDLTGLDISPYAIAQLQGRRPDRGSRLITGDLAALPQAARYDLVIGIQVFQHGTRAQAHQHLAAAAARVRAGGLLCVRVNASGTDIEHAHRRFEEDGDGSFSVRYGGGPKAGLDIHFFTAAELAAVVGRGFDTVLPPRQHVTWRAPPGRGHRGGQADQPSACDAFLAARASASMPVRPTCERGQWSQWEAIWLRH